MTSTTPTRVAGIVGGLVWVLGAVLDGVGGPQALVNALHYGGLALLALALLGIGAGLVSGLAALRVVVAICLVALGWAVLEFLHQQGSDRVVDGVIGALLAAYCAVGLLGRRDQVASARPRRSRGTHAA